jgi:quercetin dioxygenase-like cupin family protein
MKACNFNDNNEIATVAMLKKLTPTLKEAFRFSNFIGHEFKTSPWRKVDTGGQGIAHMFVPYWTEEVGLSVNTASAATVYPEHQHPGIEIFVVTVGEINLMWNGSSKIITPEKPFYFDAQYPHWATFKSDCEYVAITKPGDRDWLDGQKR